MIDKLFRELVSTAKKYCPVVDTPHEYTVVYTCTRGDKLICRQHNRGYPYYVIINISSPLSMA